MVKNYMIASLLLGSMLAGNACALGGYDYGDFYDPYGVDTDDDYYSGGDGYFYAYPDSDEDGYGDWYDPYGVDTDDDYYSDPDGYFYAYPDSGYTPEAPEPIGGEPPCYYTNAIMPHCEDNPSQNSDTFDPSVLSGFGRRLQVSSTLDDYTSWYVNDGNDIVVAGAGDEALVESGSVSVVFEGLDDETSFGLGFGLSFGLSLADMFGKALGESGLLDN